jgi:hypothetical protein
VDDYQFKLFDDMGSRAARDHAMDVVESYADIGFAEAAYDAGVQCAENNLEFIVDEVWGYLPKGVTTHDLRAMGPVMKRLQRDMVIEPTDQYRGSNKITSHKVPRVVWRSLVMQALPSAPGAPSAPGTPGAPGLTTQVGLFSK